MPAPERALGWLLGGRDGRLLLVAVGAVLGAPLAALAAPTATSALSLGLRVASLLRPPARDVDYCNLAGQAGRCLRGCA
jgi:hypothetical protein